MWLLFLVGGGAYGQAPKWGYGDTIDGMYDMDPTYFTNFWFDEEWTSDTVSGKTRLRLQEWCLYGQIDSVAQYFYTDRPTAIAGIAAAVLYYRNWDAYGRDLYTPVLSDTTPVQDYLFLLDAKPDSLELKESVPLPRDLTVAHRYFKFPNDLSAVPCSGGTVTVDTVVGMYECYFPNPVVVEDSFYVGITSSNKMGSCVGHWWTPFMSSIYVICKLEDTCKNASDINYRVRMVRSFITVVGGQPGPQVIDYGYAQCIMVLFPLLVPDTGCAAVKGLRVAEIGGDSVRLAWRRTEGHTWWEVSYGPVGVEADSGTVVVCGDTTAVLEGLEHGARYWAYVRAVCEKYNGYTYYGDWSEPVEIYNINRYNVTVEANYGERGMVEGGGVYEEGEVAVLSAHAWMPYIFRQWDDGVVENPRRVVVTQDTVFTALFTDPVGMDVTAEGEVGFSLLPNPASGRVRCVRYGQELGRGVLLLDAYGRGVATVVMEPQERSAWVDVSRLPQGVYFVSLTTAQGVSTQKLVVE